MGVTVVALHGFLGERADWQAASAASPGLRWTCLTLSPKFEFDEWAARFVAESKSRGEPPLLVGYSMGGRLALHAFAHDPSAFAGLVLLSTQPGLADDDAAGRSARAAQDEAWALRFLNDDWGTLMSDWNAQAVFAGGGPEPVRPESGGARMRAAAALRTWSVSKQKDFRPFIRAHAGRIVALNGALDRKYAGLWKELKESAPALDVREVPGSGHRVLFDAPAAVAAAVTEASSRLGRSTP